MYCCKPFWLTVYMGTPDFGAIGEGDPPPPPPPPQSATPWRPHQFRTTDTGPRYYLWVHRPSGAAPFVFRIVDNTEDTLIFNTDPSTIIGLVVDGNRHYNDAIAIFSDRCAVEFEHKWDETVVCTPDLIDNAPNSHMLGYRFLRL